MVVTHETAMNFAAVFACVRYLSSAIGALPWGLYRRRPDGGRDPFRTSPIWQILRTRPNPEMSAQTFKETLTAWALTWGNGCAEIERNAGGQVVALWPISPDRVDFKRDENKNLVYEVSNELGGTTVLLPDNVFHVHGLGFDGISGYSVVSMAARDIGSGLAADDFMNSFFGNGTIVGGVLEHPETLSQQAYDRIKESWEKRHGGPAQAWKPAILEEGMTWKSIGMPLQDAEFLASRKFTVTQIARWFGVPPHKIADLERATYTNIEHQGIEVVQDSILPWAMRFEQEADYKLIGQRNRAALYTKLDLKGLLRGDMETRGNFYQRLRELGAISVNEIRQLEDMNPIGPAGDKYVMQMQYTTLERIGEEPAPAAGPAEDEANFRQAAMAGVQRFFSTSLQRVLAKERHRAEDAARRYKGDREGFAEWCGEFFADHRDYLLRAIHDPVVALAEITCREVTQDMRAALFTITSLYADRHIAETREYLFEMFDGGRLWDDQHRAEAATAALIEQTTDALSGRIGATT